MPRTKIKDECLVYLGKVQQPIPIVEEVIDETYVVQMAGQPRYKQYGMYIADQ